VIRDLGLWMEALPALSRPGSEAGPGVRRDIPTAFDGIPDSDRGPSARSDVLVVPDPRRLARRANPRVGLPDALRAATELLGMSRSPMIALPSSSGAGLGSSALHRRFCAPPSRSSRCASLHPLVPDGPAPDPSRSERTAGLCSRRIRPRSQSDGEDVSFHRGHAGRQRCMMTPRADAMGSHAEPSDLFKRWPRSAEFSCRAAARAFRRPSSRSPSAGERRRFSGTRAGWTQGCRPGP